MLGNPEIIRCYEQFKGLKFGTKELEEEYGKARNELVVNYEQEKQLLFLRSLMTRYNDEKNLYPFHGTTFFHYDDVKKNIIVQIRGETRELNPYSDDTYPFENPIFEKYQKYLYDLLKAKYVHTNVCNLMNAISSGSYPLVTDDDVKKFEKKCESAVINIQNKKNIMNLVNIAADDTKYREKMSQISNRIKEMGPEVQRLQEEYTQSAYILNMHYDKVEIITNLEIIYSLYKWINFFDISITDLFSDIKTKEECLELDTKQRRKFTNSFVTEVKRLIPQCCMRKIELPNGFNTYYESEPNDELTFCEFIIRYCCRGRLCDVCNVVIENQTRGEKIYDMLSVLCLRDIVPLVFEYDDFKPLRQR